MVKGQEWSYVQELVAGKNTSRLQCKSCGHQFSGNATRIKEHLFRISGNVSECTAPPKDIHSKFPKYSMKVKMILASKKKGDASSSGPVDIDMTMANEVATHATHATTHVNDGCSPHVTPSSGHASTSTAIHSATKSARESFTGQTLHQALDKQWLLELHLKWTQAFAACGISFNVMRNPIFQDALMSTAKKHFVLPDYNKMRTVYLDKVKESTEAILKRTVMDFIPVYGCTIALDGWTNCQKKPLINVMLINPRGSMFVEAIDTSLKEKTTVYLCKVYERAIAMAGGPKHVTAFVTDNASNYKGAGRAIQNKYPEITWVPCAAHTLNLLLKDIGKIACVKQTLLDANHVVKFIREHQFSYALFRSKSPNKALQIFCATRFATAYYVLAALQEVKPALMEVVADRRWDAWYNKYPTYLSGAAKCAQLINSPVFWRNIDRIVVMSKPFVDLLRIVDKDSFVFGRIYWCMSQAIAKVRENTGFSAKDKAAMLMICSKRWAQMHTPLHGAAFALDPKFQMHQQSANNEVMSDFKTVCAQLLGEDDGKKAFHQRIEYANRVGMFQDPWHIDAISTTSAPLWWKEYGGECVELQHIAVKVLSVAASSGSCERNWSAFDFMHTKKRNRLHPQRAAKLVYIFCNMRLIHKPQHIATRAAQKHYGVFQTHEALAAEVDEDDDTEWELVSECSDMDEVDDMVGVFEENDEL